VVYAGLAGNVLVSATKLAAAAATGSSAMLSEGIHSLVDSGNELLLLYGMHRAASAPDAEHPLGHGRELYFWSFVVALLVFTLGAGLSVLEGVSHLRHPEPMRHAMVNYIVLGVSALFDGTSWWVAFRKYRGMPVSRVLDAVHASKDPPSFIVLLEDTAALIGLAIAFLGVLGASVLHMPALDGVASVLIGGVLAVTALLLARETKGLLIGERADQRINDDIRLLADGIDGVAHVNGLFTVHLAPAQIVAVLSMEFADELRTPEIEARVVELERRVRAKYPQVVNLFVKPQTKPRFEATRGEMAPQGQGGVTSTAVEVSCSDAGKPPSAV